MPVVAGVPGLTAVVALGSIVCLADAQSTCYGVCTFVSSWMHVGYCVVAMIIVRGSSIQGGCWVVVLSVGFFATVELFALHTLAVNRRWFQRCVHLFRWKLY